MREGVLPVAEAVELVVEGDGGGQLFHRFLAGAASGEKHDAWQQSETNFHGASHGTGKLYGAARDEDK